MEKGKHSEMTVQRNDLHREITHAVRRRLTGMIDPGGKKEANSTLHETVKNHQAII